MAAVSSLVELDRLVVVVRLAAVVAATPPTGPAAVAVVAVQAAVVDALVLHPRDRFEPMGPLLAV